MSKKVLAILLALLLAGLVYALVNATKAKAQSFPPKWGEMQDFYNYMDALDTTPTKGRCAVSKLRIRNCTVSTLRSMYPEIGPTWYLGPVVGFPNISWYQAVYYPSPSYQRIKAAR